MTPLEQFNEEMMKLVEEIFKEQAQKNPEIKLLLQTIKPHFLAYSFKLLVLHKELILTEIKERSYARLKNVDVLDWDRFEDILNEIKY